MKSTTKIPFILAASIALVSPAFAQTTGPSTLSTPYVLPVVPGIETISVLTVDNVGATPDDVVPKIGGGSYGMDGVPDGLGAFDNGDGTFTLLMNHELLTPTTGVTRDHGSSGAYVSRFILNKSNLAVVGGEDLMKRIYGWNTTTQTSDATPTTFAFARFCSGDLPAPTAFYNAGTGLGTTARIYMHGEESSPTAFRQQATVVNGASSGNSYTLGKFNLATNGSANTVNSPVQLSVVSSSTGSSAVTYGGTAPTQLAIGALLLGRTVTAINTSTKVITLSGTANATITSATPTNFTITGVGSWENALACPFAQDKTIVIGDNDGGTGIMTNSVSVYVGIKQATGLETDKAGLNNGTLKFIKVTGNPLEIVNNNTRATNIVNGTRFTLEQFESTTFSRPEDGAWNPANPAEYYFVTTDQLDQVSDSTGAQVGQTRLWRLTFDDITNPDAGGKIDILISGRTVNGEKVNMFDNICVNARNGHVLLQEDVGNADHNGKVWDYDPATNALVQVLKHDPARFGDITTSGIVTAATLPFNRDEETSGVIDITSIMATSALTKGYTDEAWYLSADQAHYTTVTQGANPPSPLTAAQAEGGQLFAIHDTAAANNIAVTRGGLARDRRTGAFTQQITIKNNNATALDSPFYLVIDALSANASLSNSAGVTTVNSPTGSPYVVIAANSLPPGATASIALQFTNPSNGAITYTTRVLSGIVTP